jgi:hypothetical protein
LWSSLLLFFSRSLFFLLFDAVDDEATLWEETASDKVI